MSQLSQLLVRKLCVEAEFGIFSFHSALRRMGEWAHGKSALKPAYKIARRESVSSKIVVLLAKAVVILVSLLYSSYYLHFS